MQQVSLKNLSVCSENTVLLHTSASFMVLNQCFLQLVLHIQSKVNKNKNLKLSESKIIS